MATGQGRVASEARGVIGWPLMELRSAMLSEVGKRFDRDAATMSSAVGRLVDRASDPKALRDQHGRAQPRDRVDKSCCLTGLTRAFIFIPGISKKSPEVRKLHWLTWPLPGD
jgi:hypothetical protein